MLMFLVTTLAHAAPAFTVGAGAVQTVRVERGTLTAAVGLIVTPAFTPKGPPQVVAITLPGGGPGAGDLFTAEVKDVTTAPRVVLTSSKVVEPGVYALKIRFPGITDPALVDVQLTVPSAKVRVATPLLLEQVCAWPVGPCTVTGGARVDVEETSGLSELTHLGLTQFGPTMNGTRPVSGRVEAAPELADLVLEPDETGRFTLSAVPDFPFGRSASKLIVHADELASDEEIPIEVVTRLSPCWFAFFIVVGAFGGLLTRVIEPWYVGRQKPKADADAALAALDHLVLSPDAALAEVGREQRTRVRAALGGSATGPIVATVAAAKTARLEALKEYAGRLDGARAILARLGREAARTWVLPSDAQAKYAASRLAASGAAAAVARGDSVTAAADAKTAQEDRDAAVEAVKAWRGAARTTIDGVKTLATRTPIALAERRRLLVEAFKATGFEAAPPDLFDAAHAAAALTAALAGDAEEGLGATMTALREAEVTLAFSIPPAVGVPKPATDPVARVRAVADAVLLVQDRILASVPDAAKQTQWLTGDFVNAVKLAKFGGVQGDTTAPTEPEVGEPAAAEDLQPTTVPPAPEGPVSAPAAEGYEPWLSFLLRKGIGSVLSIGILLLLGFATQWEGFYGTPANVLALFTWAFGVDLGIGQIVARVGPGGRDPAG